MLFDLNLINWRILLIIMNTKFCYLKKRLSTIPEDKPYPLPKQNQLTPRDEVYPFQRHNFTTVYNPKVGALFKTHSITNFSDSALIFPDYDQSLKLRRQNKNKNSSKLFIPPPKQNESLWGCIKNLFNSCK